MQIKELIERLTFLSEKHPDAEVYIEKKPIDYIMVVGTDNKVLLKTEKEN